MIYGLNDQQAAEENYCRKHDLYDCWFCSDNPDKEPIKQSMVLFGTIVNLFDEQVEQHSWVMACETVVKYAQDAYLGNQLESTRIVEAARFVANVATRTSGRIPYQPPEVMKTEMWEVRNNLFSLGQMLTEPDTLR